MPVAPPILCDPARRRLAALLAATLLWIPTLASAYPAGFIAETIGSGWNEAVGITFADDGRTFVWERGGRIWFVDANGNKSAQPVLDIHDEVGGWRDYGLLGVALHPNFLANGYVYLLYVVDRHHLLHAGTPSYDPNADEYFAATIGRVTRYRLKLEDDFMSTDYASRLVLLGETIDTGIPILHQSHGTGSLVFGSDGTLLGSTGDGASYSSTDTGSAGETYYAQGLADGIITDKENVGAFRSQLVDSHDGTVFRIDPDTGDGVPSNPFYDATAPRAPRSRTFAVGLRNPYRMVMKPGSGSHDPADADPGVFYIGDVGWGTWEDIHVLSSPGQNFGWPNFEGIDPHNGYNNSNTLNQDAPNPLFGIDVPGQGICNQQYFRFSDLIQQATLDPNPSFPNPCDPAQQIPDTWFDGQTTHRYYKFVHDAPPIDYRHGSGPSRWTSFDGFDLVVTDIGTDTDPNGKSVPGPQFGGNTSTGGVFYTGGTSGGNYPAEFYGSYFHGDYGSQWIRNFLFDAADEPLEAKDFHGGAGGVVHLATHPITGDLHYIQWTAVVYRVRYVGTGNQPPIAVASQDVQYGPTPLLVSFTGDQSSDPESGPLTYAWDFGDGSPIDTAANPSHSFVATPGVPTPYTVTLTVTDDQSEVSQPVALLVSVENTPPVVDITSPVDGTLYSMQGLGETRPLTATITDAEQGGGFSCTWSRALHHNTHDHPEPVISECVTSEEIVYTPVGCDGNTYFYRASLSVTDSGGLTTTAVADAFPDCPNVAPLARDDSAVVAQGYAVDIDVLSNDIDPDGDPLDPSTVVVVDPPANGSTLVDPVTGEIQYQHDASMATSDSFTYTVADLDPSDPLVSSVGTVTISAFNDAPILALTSPTDGSTFTVGGSVVLQATGSDAQDGAGLPIDWALHRLHNDQLIPFVFTTTGESPAPYVVPAIGAPGDRISYLVEATATDLVGATDSAQVQIVPATPPAGNGAPTASFGASATQVVSGLPVNFDASASSDPEGDFLLYAWDFDDGAQATGLAAVHAFAAAGSYDVVLTVTDAAGASDSALVTIDVLAPGLQGEYYDDQFLTDPPALVRSDPTVDFTWGSGSPDPSIGNNTFSVRWTGRIEALYDESYTIYTTSDDGIRVWIDGNLIIDEWNDHGPQEDSGVASLQAGMLHDIVIEYYENGGGAVAQLSWQSASQPKQIVPAGRLYPPAPPNAAPLAVDDLSGTLTIFPVPIAVLANDLDDRGQLDPTSVVASDGASGTTSVDPVTGVVTYTPDGVTTGTDFFTYTVADLQGATSNVATVTVNVLEASSIQIDFPSDGGVAVGPDVTVLFTIAGDSSLFDHLHWVLDGGPIVMDHVHDGSYVYSDLAAGPHDVSVSMQDGQHQPVGFPNSQDSVSFTVTLPSAPPLANPDVANVIESQSVDIPVLHNDLDDGGLDPASIAVGNGSVGTTSFNPTTGVVTYTHGGAVATFDSFSYTVRDLDGILSNAATVTVHITDGDLVLTNLVADQLLNEGDLMAYFATATSQTSPNALSFDWDLDGDGAYDDFTESPGVGTQTSSGSVWVVEDGVHSLGVRLGDGTGRIVVGSFLLTANNVAPVVEGLTEDLLVEPGASFSYQASASDAGSLDVLTFEWDLDGDGQYDDRTHVAGAGPQNSFGVMSFATPGLYTVGVRVSDDEGASTLASFDVQVGALQNVPGLGIFGRVLLMGGLAVAGAIPLVRGRRRR